MHFTRKQKRKVIGISAGLCCYALQEIIKGKPTRNPRRFSVHPVNMENTNKFYLSRFLPMKKANDSLFFSYTRMTAESFNELLGLIQRRLVKNSNREPICEEEQLAITIHYLAHGTSMSETAIVYSRGKTTVSKIIANTCEAIWDILRPEYLRPLNEVNFGDIANRYSDLWQMPFCCGSIDGKHVSVQAPWHSGSLNYNHKKFFSIQLLAACDADLKFIFADIGEIFTAVLLLTTCSGDNVLFLAKNVLLGANGSSCDSTIFKKTSLADMVNEKPGPNEYWPEDGVLPNTNQLFPHYFVADAAFCLSKRLMKPYGGKFLNKEQTIFNYRLSRARRTIENAFGVLASRWRIMRKPIIARKRTAKKIIAATVCLHNFLCSKGHINPTDEHREEVQVATRMPFSVGVNRSSNLAVEMRNYLCQYFNTRGAVPWQWDIIPH